MPTLASLIAQVYPDFQEHIINSLSDNLRSHQLDELISPQTSPITLYSTYPDGFEENGVRNLKTLENKLSYIRNLGCDAIHILPFFPSPLVDGGFDIENYLEIRSDLGSLDDFEHFMSMANQHNIKVFIDLAFNHVSIKHDWFLQAQESIEPYTNYFIACEKKPILLGIKDSVASYEIDDRHMSAQVIFPDQAGELPHWVQGTDGRWYFHTFYPHQIDLNWKSPEVFIAISKIIEFWVSKGVHIRLDAAAHLDKNIEGSIVKNSERNHLLVALIRSIQLLTNHESLLIAEVVDDLESIKAYTHSPKLIQSDYVYNFYTLNGLWAALELGDGKELLDALSMISNEEFPSWINFLRSHDALMLGFINSEIVKLTHDSLIKRGRAFGRGLEIAGRVASFLHNQPQQIIFAHFLLASLPGSLSIFYGDEIGKQNSTEFVDQEVWRKRHLTGDDSIAPDQRDLGRGIVHTSEYYGGKGQYLYKSIQEILSVRSLHISSFSNGIHIPTKRDDQLILFHHLTSPKLTIYANPTPEFITRPFSHEGQIILNCGGAIAEKDELILPPKSGVWTLSKS